MASRKIIALHLFLVFLAVAAAGHQKHRRQRNKRTNNVVVDGSAPDQCPPPYGIIRIHGQSGNMASYSSGGLSNLLFMCGTTQVPYQAPSRWIMREGPDGSLVNMTIYEKRYKMVPLCCPGYTRNQVDVCVPKCKGNCTNGLCVAPEQCVCYEGYALNNIGECVLTCPCGCPNGVCRGNTCFCNRGYELNSNGVCNPTCVNKCENGDCTSPNQCTCHLGYKKKRNQDTHICFPHCTGTCRNGKCVAPNNCECNEGYHKDGNTGSCVPTCSGCENGECVAPYTCHCNRGYRRHNEDCTPVCEEGCFNATCTSPNDCTCFKGYMAVSRNVCKPRCIPNCKNAKCVAPNQCQCFNGFMKENGLLPSHKCVSITGADERGITNIANNVTRHKRSLISNAFKKFFVP